MVMRFGARASKNLANAKAKTTTTAKRIDGRISKQYIYIASLYVTSWRPCWFRWKLNFIFMQIICV